MTLIGSKVLVIWQWEWLNTTEALEQELEQELDSCSDGERTELTVVPETPPPESSDSEHDSTSEAPSIDSSNIKHTVMFKCIGCHKDVEYQEALKRASQLRSRGEVVECKLQQEPDNPYDSQAIAFLCNVDNKWKRIGYAVQEVLEELNEAISRKKITDVSIEWVKYVIFWQSPAWYAGINITRKGKWSHVILRSQSARM